MSNRETQASRVLRDLKAGTSVTKLTAVHNGIGNIHDVIMTLRNRGHVIDLVTGTDHHGKRYSKYVYRQKLSA